MRSGIQRYNLSQGNPQGYHETITFAWLAILARELRQHRITELTRENEASSAREIGTIYGDQDFLHRYYTRERLMSDEARAHWVPPDRRAIE
jgi:hypothetical protein